jgi:hypothetical protein
MKLDRWHYARLYKIAHRFQCSQSDVPREGSIIRSKRKEDPLKLCLSGRPADRHAVSSLRRLEGSTGEHGENVPLTATIEESRRNNCDGRRAHGNQLYAGDRLQHVVPALGTDSRLFWHDASYFGVVMDVCAILHTEWVAVWTHKNAKAPLQPKLYTRKARTRLVPLLGIPGGRRSGLADSLSLTGMLMKLSYCILPRRCVFLP